MKVEQIVENNRPRTPSPPQFRLPSHPASNRQKRTQSIAELTPERGRISRTQQNITQEDNPEEDEVNEEEDNLEEDKVTEEEDSLEENEVGETKETNKITQTSSIYQKKKGTKEQDKEIQHLTQHSRPTRSGRVPKRSRRINSIDNN